MRSEWTYMAVNLWGPTTSSVSAGQFHSGLSELSDGQFAAMAVIDSFVIKLQFRERGALRGNGLDRFVREVATLPDIEGHERRAIRLSAVTRGQFAAMVERGE